MTELKSNTKVHTVGKVMINRVKIRMKNKNFRKIRNKEEVYKIKLTPGGGDGRGDLFSGTVNLSFEAIYLLH